MNIAAFLMALVGPLAKRVLAAFGFGIIGFGAVLVAFNAAKAQLLSLYGQASFDVVWMIERAGLVSFMGIVLGALAAKVGLQMMSKLGRIDA